MRGSHLFFAGRPLTGVKHELETYANVLAEMNQLAQRKFLICHYIEVKKLHGSNPPKSDKSIIVQPEEERNLSYEDLLKTDDESVRAAAVVGNLDLLVFFQDWEAAKSFLLKAGALHPQMSTVFYQVRYTFLEGLICIKAARTSKMWLEKRKWKKRAIKSMKKMRSWLKKGNVNCTQTMHILTAEYAALNGKKQDAEEQFKAAVATAARNGFLQDKALAHELAGIYYESQGDEYWAKFNMERAHRSYLDWQAFVKAKDLAEKKAYLLGD